LGTTPGPPTKCELPPLFFWQDLSDQQSEQMNIEQGMSKEEGRRLSEKMATKNAKNHKERYKPTSLRI
jgi:hypothetical protein